MVFRKHNSTAGFSLIEVLVAITILGLVIAPIGSSLVLSFRLNARSDEVLQAQLAVSSAVETIMAEGYDKSSSTEYETRFPAVTITAIPDNNSSPVYYDLTVQDKNGYVNVETCVKPYVEPIPEEGEGE